MIPGGSGHEGTVVARSLHREGHEVVVLNCRPHSRPCRVVPWDGATHGAWTTEVDGNDVVINLTGGKVNCRHTARHRQEILESRVAPTRVVGAANDEASGLIGGEKAGGPRTWKFSIAVARAWERAFDESITPKTRKIALRSAMTLSPDAASIFDVLVMLVRRGLGGKAGNGRQFVSWIHFEDFIRATRWLIDHEEIAGLVNVASPHPVPNEELMRGLRAASGTRVGLPATRLDARDRRRVDAKRDGAHSEEPQCRARAVGQWRVCL